MWLLLKHQNIWLDCTAEGEKKKKGPNSWTHFCQRHPANRWHWFQIKFHIWAERFLKARMFINAFFLSLYFQLSHLSLALLSLYPQRNDISEDQGLRNIYTIFLTKSVRMQCGRTAHHDLESSPTL